MVSDAHKSNFTGIFPTLAEVSFPKNEKVNETINNPFHTVARVDASGYLPLLLHE
jgi:hypothetical protein